MKLSDIITNTNPKLDTWFDINDLAAEFGINDTFYGSQDRITCRFFHVWQCTDTWVGGRVYFMDNEPVCISFQATRKSAKRFQWISRELADKVRNYILELGFSEPLDTLEYFEDCELDDSYTVEYSSNIIHKTGLLNGVEVEIVKVYQYPEFHKVQVCSNGSLIDVDCRELHFKYNTI